MYFNLRSNADINQLNLPHGTKLKKWNRKKLKSKKNGYATEVSVNSLRNPWSQFWRKGRLRWEGFAEKECFEPGMKE